MTSPAIEPGRLRHRTVDQRGVQRPQGVRCDAGAYEFNTAPDTTVGGAGPPFTFSSNEAGTTFECSLDGAPFTPCAAAVRSGRRARNPHPRGPRGGPAGPRPTPATMTFTVQPPPATPTPTPSPTPTPTPTATPVVNRTIVVGPARGTVKVKVPGAKRYVELDSTIGIPVGSSVDTRKGRVTLTSIPKAGAPPQTAVFYDGLFKVTQSRGITNLTLTEQLAACPKKKRPRERRREEGQEAEAVGRREGRVPHEWQVQRRDRPRHEVARGGHLRRHADHRSGRAASLSATATARSSCAPARTYLAKPR